MNIDGSEFEDEMIEDELPSVEPVEDEPEEEVTFIGGSGEEEIPPTYKEQRLALYNTLAVTLPLVEEAVEGVSTFRQALDEMVYELEHPQNESESIVQFTYYITALELLTGEETVDEKGMTDVINHHVNNTKSIKGVVKALTIGGGVTFGGSLGVGFVIERWYPEIAHLLKIAGTSGLGATGAFRGIVGTQNWLQKKKANKQFAPLYEIADTLDAEVAELYQSEE